MARSDEYIEYDSAGVKDVRTVVQNMQMMVGMYDKPVFTVYKGVRVFFKFGDDVSRVASDLSDKLSGR